MWFASAACDDGLLAPLLLEVGRAHARLATRFVRGPRRPLPRRRRRHQLHVDRHHIPHILDHLRVGELHASTRRARYWPYMYLQKPKFDSAAELESNGITRTHIVPKNATR